MDARPCCRTSACSCSASQCRSLAWLVAMPCHAHHAILRAISDEPPLSIARLGPGSYFQRASRLTTPECIREQRSAHWAWAAVCQPRGAAARQFVTAEVHTHPVHTPARKGLRKQIVLSVVIKWCPENGASRWTSPSKFARVRERADISDALSVGEVARRACSCRLLAASSVLCPAVTTRPTGGGCRITVARRGRARVRAAAAPASTATCAPLRRVDT